jgi:hypothetical protein
MRESFFGTNFFAVMEGEYIIRPAFAAQNLV